MATAADRASRCATGCARGARPLRPRRPSNPHRSATTPRPALLGRGPRRRQPAAAWTPAGVAQGRAGPVRGSGGVRRAAAAGSVEHGHRVGAGRALDPGRRPRGVAALSAAWAFAGRAAPFLLSWSRSYRGATPVHADGPHVLPPRQGTPPDGSTPAPLVGHARAGRGARAGTPRSRTGPRAAVGLRAAAGPGPAAGRGEPARRPRVGGLPRAGRPGLVAVDPGGGGRPGPAGADRADAEGQVVRRVDPQRRDRAQGRRLRHELPGRQPRGTRADDRLPNGAVGGRRLPSAAHEGREGVVPRLDQPLRRCDRLGAGGAGAPAGRAVRPLRTWWSRLRRS